ncbi:hypothetical protein U6X77_12335, partial [Cutibacterium acnes]
MDIKLFLVKSISLIYLENLAAKPSSSNRKMIRDILSAVKLNEEAADIADGRSVLINLRTTLLWMLNNGDSHEYDPESLLQRLRLNTQHDDVTYKALEKMIRKYPDTEIAFRYSMDIAKELRRYNSQARLREIIKKANHTLAFREAEVEDWDGFVLQTAQDLLAVDMETEERTDPAFI